MAVWGISSNGRAPALHAGGTGINAWILHTKSVINELLLWETSLLFTIGPMHAYIRVQRLTTKPHSSKSYFQTSKIFHICHVGILSIHTGLGIHWCQCSRYQVLNARLGGERRASFVNMHEAHHKNYCHRRFGYLHDVICSSIFCFRIGRNI